MAVRTRAERALRQSRNQLRLEIRQRERMAETVRRSERLASLGTFAARLRARFPRMRTIIMTGYPAAELARPVGAGEVNVLLAKPFSPTALFDAVKRLAGGCS